MIDFAKIEKKWQKKWEKEKLGEADPDKRKKFFMIFAYPGISGYLHVGHMRGFSYTDIICRYKRMKGFNVLFPIGTHASGNQAIAFANKIKNKDKDWITYLKNNGCPPNLIPQLVNADKVVDYFNDVYVNEYWKRFGFLADFRRFTSTIYPDYNKFIQWQFKKLSDNNLLVQKPYFATFCPECGPVAVDPSETDISKGGNAEKNEYTFLKFEYGDDFIVAATLRPETVFGQTNLWINPDAVYVRAEVGDETWIMSKEAADKLGYQKDSVKVVKELKGKELIGKFVVAPGVDKEIIILPSTFCDPDLGSGIVTSVPSDAPYDWIALKDLQNDKNLIKTYNLPEDVKNIKPIAIITSKGFGEHPAIEICKKMGIKSQKDTEKLEIATKEIYKTGFHTGMMNDNCGKYAGKKVEEAKELVKQELIELGKADVFHDLSEEVICRCGQRIIIKRIDDQWFIKYSDGELTQKSKDCASQMEIQPEAYDRNISKVLDWFMDRACTRLGNWLGTRLPFDDKWTVEPISDSTLYPAFYIVSKYINDERVSVNQLTEEFFDYVFLGKGKKYDVMKKLKIAGDLLDQIRDDFTYWYPLDTNLGGKEHQTVHFPVFIMNHVAILDKKFWPKGIFVNYWIIGKGSKISKSKGGAVPIPDAIQKYSVDGMRLYYAHVGSPHADIEWDEDVVFHYKQAVEKIFTFVDEHLGGKESKNEQLDKWLVSRMHELIKNVSLAMENSDLREAATQLYFQFFDVLRWYARRGGANKGILKEILSHWMKLTCPITPHTSEEIWEKLGNKGLISTEKWPAYDEKKIDLLAESQERVLERVIGDIRNVIKLSKLDKPKEVTLFTAPSWKFDLFREVKKQIGVTRDVGQIMREIMQDETIKKNAKDVNKIILSLVKDPTRIPNIVGESDEEFKYFEKNKKFLSQELGVAVKVTKAEESKEDKSKQAMPGKPGVLVK